MKQMTNKKSKPLLDCVIELNKQTAGTDQYATPKGERPEGVRVLMLENWIQDDAAQKLRIVITEVNE